MLQLVKGKTNQVGHTEYGACMRHKDLRVRIESHS
jgi:hypothetical protein